MDTSCRFCSAIMAAQKAVYKNSEVKNRVFERLSASVVDSGKVVQSVVKNSKSKDIIHQATKQFVNLDSTITNMEQNIDNVKNISKKMEAQYIITGQNLQCIERLTMKVHEV